MHVPKAKRFDFDLLIQIDDFLDAYCRAACAPCQIKRNAAIGTPTANSRGSASRASGSGGASAFRASGSGGASVSGASAEDPLFDWRSTQWWAYGDGTISRDKYRRRFDANRGGHAWGKDTFDLAVDCVREVHGIHPSDALYFVLHSGFITATACVYLLFFCSPKFLIAL
jgi:hypothetical protein